MKNHTQNCPSVWKQITSDGNLTRTCGKKTNGSGCDSLVISTRGKPYKSVQGQITAYQFGTPDAFQVNTSSNIDDAYVDGISITHGQNPRKHIFTLAVGIVQYFAPEELQLSTCPNTGYGLPPPTFVAEKYFCSSGAPGPDIVGGTHYGGIPLWSNHYESKCDKCYDTTKPRSFSITMPENTTDDLELRVCTDEDLTNEDIRIEKVDIYIL